MKFSWHAKMNLRTQLMKRVKHLTIPPLCRDLRLTTLRTRQVLSK